MKLCACAVFLLCLSLSTTLLTHFLFLPFLVFTIHIAIRIISQKSGIVTPLIIVFDDRLKNDPGMIQEVA